MTIEKPKYKYNSVLLVDDNEVDNFINEKILEANYFSATINISVNGKMALDYLYNCITASPGESFPDLIFVDLNMPVMNGFELIEKFKNIKNEKFSNCRIIILTSSIFTQDRVKAEKLDSNIVFVNKPLTKEILNIL